MDEADFEILERELERTVRDYHIFRLHAVDGYSPEEIALMVGMSARKVRWRISKCRKRLRARLTPSLCDILVGG